MNLATLLAINAVLAIGHGLGFIFLPSTLLALYEVPTASGAVLMGQLFGVQLLFVAVVTWSGRKIIDGRALGAIVLGGATTSAAGTIVTAKALVDGVFGPMGWLALAIYGALTIAYVYFQLQPAKRGG
ncbi:hypothetical protein [Reyranella sp.]|uniref:hypothetical protein n=1 Tax=Reyranella sp. TaxID=1929291 RepID=UPI003D14D706